MLSLSGWRVVFGTNQTWTISNAGSSAARRAEHEILSRVIIFIVETGSKSAAGLVKAADSSMSIFGNSFGKSLWSRFVPKSGEIWATFQRPISETSFVSSNSGALASHSRFRRTLFWTEKSPPNVGFFRCAFLRHSRFRERPYRLRRSLHVISRIFPFSGGAIRRLKK
jgi:hypothetical protein